MHNNRSTQLMSLLCFGFTFSCILQSAWTRSLSVSLNLSLTRSVSDDNNVTETIPKLSEQMLNICMRETEISMTQLKLFRLSLLASDYNTNNDNDNDNEMGNNVADMDYVNSPQMPFVDLKHNEPLQCFVRCLYEQLNLLKYDKLLEDAFKLQHEKPEAKECADVQSKNRCEAVYKLHLCYNHLRSLEAEQRIREVLERNDNDLENTAKDADGSTEANTEEGDEGEVIIDGIKHAEENN